jgi:hypothetical protein
MTHEDTLDPEGQFNISAESPFKCRFTFPVLTPMVPAGGRPSDPRALPQAGG